MESVHWAGVMPAVTTPFLEGGDVDHAFLGRHVDWLVTHGASGIVPLGSLGEGNTLTKEEKRSVVKTCVEAVAGRVPVVPGVAALSTAEAVALAEDCAELACRGLMVLPPYVYRGTWRETQAHFVAVLEATALPCMLYNNPVAYGTDVVPAHVAELAGEHENLQAVKESSGDVKRITAIRALLGDRLAIFCGLDDVVWEGVHAGAAGWVAGLVNALPEESVRLFELARDGRDAEAFALYRWFLPLLRMDTVYDFVQRIKLVQQEVGMGSERVRPPRLPLEGGTRQECLETIRSALASVPGDEWAEKRSQ